MAEMKFTPGPWRVVYRPQRGQQIEWGDGTKERPICHMRWTDGLGETRVDADARLIAAAPDMYAALQELADARDGDDLLGWVRDTARAALSSAQPNPTREGE